METNQGATARSRSDSVGGSGDGGNEKTESDFLLSLLEALQAMRAGDRSARLNAKGAGLTGKIADAFNDIVSANEQMAREIRSVGQIVGREGRTSTRVRLVSTSGAWAEVQRSVNEMIDDLSWPTTAVAQAVEAVAQGDLSRTVPLEVEGRRLKGEFLRSARIVNKMIEQLAEFTSEVTRVAREVGTDGKLGGQAQVRQASGVWRDLTESVNSMASNLTAQVRNIAEVTIAVANGDLSKKISVDVRGEFLQLKEAINTMVDQLRSFASEVTRVAREVGTEGRLGGQALVPGVAGTWKDLTDSVNAMCGNLTDQVRNIAQVTTAVARGDLSRKITVDVRGELLELKDTVNTMVDQLNRFASEVTRIAREVGTEGRLGGQAHVMGVAGAWKDLTESVNSMASNLTDQMRNISEVSTAIANGDLSKKITVNLSGEILEIKETINTMVDQLNAFAGEVTRVAREVGTEGRLGGQARVHGVAGTWKDLTDAVNSMASNLTGQVRDIAQVATAVAHGDLSRKVKVEVRGEILELKETINTMVEQLSAFAGEVTRVAREVGTEGRLGGQARAPGVAGVWKDLTDSVNTMACNLTGQVRNIAEVATAIADGDLSRKITVDVRGEILQLKETLNTMVDQLNRFAGEVTRVAREVGIEGKLGGQAAVPGVAGTWKDLTDNVNELAANLTTQVRAIAEVATAVTEGDLTRSIQIETRGEMADLKDNINTMIGNLRLTTERNTEQDWLKTNLARFTNLLQGQRDLAAVGQILLSALAPQVGAQNGVIYLMDSGGSPILRRLSSYADGGSRGHAQTLQLGEGLIGQCALDARPILIAGTQCNAAPIRTGLFELKPTNLIILPILFEGRVKAVMELASVFPFTGLQKSFLDQLTASIGIVLNSIEASMQTEEFLKQSRRLAAELERRVADRTAELAATNADLEMRVEVRTREREQALAQIAEMQKLESLGKLTGGLAHDFNNLLMVVLSNLELAHKHAAGEDRLTGWLGRAKVAAESGAALTRRMLAFARRQELKPEPTSLADVVHGMTEMLSHSLDPTLRISVDVPNDLPSVLIDRNQFEVALLNLALNARDAMTSGGVLSISARPADQETLPEKLERGAYMLLSVADTGMGMDADTLKRASEPFFTTKPVGKGSGLGLSMVHGLTMQSGGAMQISSRLNEGTTVLLWLPTATEPATTTIGPALADIREPSHRVMVVDDDPLILAGTADMLRELGHEPIETSSPTQALELLRGGEPPDLAILDYAMAEMSGASLAQRIREICPTLPLLLATGYADSLGAADLPRLEKPYTLAELARQISLLARRARLSQ